MDCINTIIRMRDCSLKHGADGSARGFIRKWRENLHKSGQRIDIKDLNGDPQGQAVQAYIHQGAWIAACECGGHEYVDPDEPVFFCWSCLNRMNSSYLRPVEFPADWQAIEFLILQRPVNDLRGTTDLDRATGATPRVVVLTDEGEFPLVRSWKPGESIDELVRQNSALDGVSPKFGETVLVDMRQVNNGI